MLDNLYDNIGGKIKNWAQWIFIVEAIAAIIGGIFMLFEGDDTTFWGIILIIAGPVVAWVSSWILYAFGDIVENISDIRHKYVGIKIDPPAQPFTNAAPPTPPILFSILPLMLLRPIII